MIDKEHALPLTRQSRILELSRSSLYYQAVPVSDRDLELMRLIDEIHLKHPFMGSRRIRDQLQDLGHKVGRQHVSTLMRKMGISALYRKPRLSKPHPDHKIYPYLLRGSGDHQSQSCVGCRYHVYPDGKGLLLPRGDYGLGKSEGTGMEAIQHPGCFLLCRSAKGSACEVRNS